MSAWSGLAPHSGAVLIRQFAVLSFAIVGLITVALCAVISHYFREDLLEREWTTTADFIRTQVLQNLAPADFHSPGGPGTQEHFRKFYQQTVMMPQVKRVKIYDTSMTVIWSDEPRLIGQRFPDNAQLTGAIAGRTTVNLETGREKGENVYERGEPELVEVYVPIVFPDSSRVLGVVETYKETTQVLAKIRRGQMIVVATALAGGALLYLSLFWIVLRASRRIDAQHHSLERQSRDVLAANEELRAVQAQLIEAERMAAIGEVVASVAHGIRNPLANIRASAQVALLDCTDADPTAVGPRSLTNIMAEVDRLAARLKELLRFVRPAERRGQPIDLNTVLQRALELLAGRFAEAHIRLERRLAPALPVISGDPMILEQIFVNLIGNAVEAMSADGGTITVTTGTERHEGGALRVFSEVGDSGCGIPPEKIGKIFDLFYTSKAQGTGLGLAVTKKFTEAHGGTISVQSSPGEGATFRVTFPCRSAPEPQLAGAKAEPRRFP
jgi:two-component system sensor histidine kinase HydH